MIMKRTTTFLFTVSFIFLVTSGYSQNDVNVLLIARSIGEKVLSNMDTIRVFGFASSLSQQPGVPGPTIFANEGDSIHVDLWNVSQGAPHTIHWHGLDVDQQNDGVPHLSFDVAHMDHGYYNFIAPHPGTYLYHCHVASTIHVQAGMYGLVIVRPADGSNVTWENGYDYAQDFSYFLSEIDTLWHNDTILDHEHDTSLQVHNVTLPKYEPQFFLVNGFSDQQIAAENISLTSQVGAVNYLRFSNIGFYGNRIILPPGLNSKIIDSDGRPLPLSEVSDTIYVFPGERYGVLCEANEELHDSITFEYLNLNTLEVKNRQFVPVEIEDFTGDIHQEFGKVDVNIRPNAFTSQTNLNITLKQAAKIRVEVLNPTGILISTFLNKTLVSGEHSFIMNNENFPTKGLYLLKVTVDDEKVISKKVVRY